MVFIYTTAATLEDAELLAHTIVEQKLGACVDYWPIGSVYRWEGEVKQMPRVMIMISTLERHIEEINDLVPDHTTYSTPLISGVNVDRIGRAFKEWMIHEVA